MSTPKSKHGKRYTSSFKKEAVLYYRSSGKSYKEVAEELDISDASLCTWNKELTEKENPSSDTLESSEREELHRLRRENKRLKMETEIIKKAMVFFARDQK
jgi:transposase